jgi:hypothetical protein
VRIIVLILALVLSACASHPSLKELDCNPSFGSCSASLDPQGYDWYVTTDTECAVVTMETGEKLPVCDYKRLLGQDAEYGIKSCQACVRRAQQ